MRVFLSLFVTILFLSLASTISLAQSSSPIPAKDRVPVDPNTGGVNNPRSGYGDPDPRLSREMSPDGAGSTNGVTPPPSPGNLRGADNSVGWFSESPWFALVSGLASILGLLFPLYATQVRSIPVSLYRSLVWRKLLLIAGGVGIAVFAGVKISNLEGAFYRIVEMISVFASQGRARLTYPSGYLITLFWIALILFGVILSTKGVRYDPIARAREVIIREQDFLGKARALQVDSLLARRNIDALSQPERRALRDIMDFYRYIQWRYADVVLGAPPPAFPLFRGNITSGINEDDA